MNTFKWNILGLALLMSVSLCSSLAWAQSPRIGGAYVPPVALEGDNLVLSVSDKGELVAIGISECDRDECVRRTFLPASDIEIRVENKPTSARQATAANGRGGTVLYDSETGLAEVVIFFGQ